MRNRISEIRPVLKFFSNYCNLYILVLGFRGLFDFRLSLEVCSGFAVLTVDVCMVCGSYLTAQSQFFIVLLQSTELAKNAKKYSNNNLTNELNIQPAGQISHSPSYYTPTGSILDRTRAKHSVMY
jgi:hypothetical protein